MGFLENLLVKAIIVKNNIRTGTGRFIVNTRRVALLDSVFSDNIAENTVDEKGTLYKFNHVAPNNSIIEDKFFEVRDCKPNNIKQINKKVFGTTSERPDNIHIGFQYYDTSINKPIYWTGSAWVDATGTAV